MKKILLALTVMFVISGCAFAKVTVEQVRSEEYMTSEGYSKATIKAVQVEAGEYKVAPTNKAQKFGFKIWNYIDPISPRPRDEARHDISPYPKGTDL